MDEPDLKEIFLNRPKEKGIKTFEELLVKRRSIRSYSEKAISFSNISQILWAAYGSSEYNKDNGNGFMLRTVPSAGAIYPLRIYIIIKKVEKLEQGVYKYSYKKHSLKSIKFGNIHNELSKLVFDNKYILDSPAVILYCADNTKMFERYGNRGVSRYSMIEIGHSAQNVYLQSASIGISVCSIGAFRDKDLNKLLNLPVYENPVHMLTIGISKIIG